jgi:hypothetical protein
MGNSSMSRFCYPLGRSEKFDQLTTSLSKTERETPRQKLSAKFKSVYNYVKSKTLTNQQFDGHSRPCSSTAPHTNMSDSTNSYASDSDALDLEQRNIRELVANYKTSFFDKNLSDMIDKILPTVRSVIMKK